jgi:hypothetical protein
MTHAQVAKKVRIDKETHPEKYCKHPKCLFRLEEPGWCPKHKPAVMVG